MEKLHINLRVLGVKIVENDWFKNNNNKNIYIFGSGT